MQISIHKSNNTEANKRNQELHKPGGNVSHKCKHWTMTLGTGGTGIEGLRRGMANLSKVTMSC